MKEILSVAGCGRNLGEKQMDKMVEIKWHDKNAQKMTVHNKNGVVNRIPLV